MRQPKSVKSLEDLGRIRLSENFFLRDFLYSEIAVIHGFQNIPDDPDLAVATGTILCETLLEPLQARFGKISIRSAYRSSQVNHFGNINKLNCGRNETNHAGHIWDRRDASGRMGATACIVVNRFVPYYRRTGDWEAMAWWIHDHLPYSVMEFFPDSPPSTCNGARTPSAASTASSRPDGACSPSRAWTTGRESMNWPMRRCLPNSGRGTSLSHPPCHPGEGRDPS